VRTFVTERVDTAHCLRLEKRTAGFRSWILLLSSDVKKKEENLKKFMIS